MAAPVLRAITATPPSGWNLDGQGQPCTSITFSTPETFIAAAPSNDTSLPPVTGGRAITAHFIPGRRVVLPQYSVPARKATKATHPTLALSRYPDALWAFTLPLFPAIPPFLPPTPATT